MTAKGAKPARVASLPVRVSEPDECTLCRQEAWLRTSAAADAPMAQHVLVWAAGYVAAAGVAFGVDLPFCAAHLAALEAAWRLLGLGVETSGSPTPRASTP
jgi:hypothetical protein